MPLPSSLRLRGFAVALAAFSLMGCSKKIGDPCTLSADCGVQNNRQCDTAQVDGYCTQIGCTADGCPGEAACFLFQPRLAGCSYDDREAARTSRSFCMYSCDHDNDCRDGYVCGEVTKEPWGAVLLDTIDIKPKACIVAASFQDGVDAGAADPAICSPIGPAAEQPDASSSADAGSSGTDASAP